MAEWCYAEFDIEKASREELLRRLRSLFHDLLLQAGGDVEEALRLLDLIGRRYGLWKNGLTIEDLRRFLEEQGAVKAEAGRLRLTPGGERVLRAESLEAVFGSLVKDVAGEHRTESAGEGGERLPETRPWAFGDPLSLLDAPGSLSAAMRRAGLEELELSEEDLAVFETEHHASCATVLLIDVSHSMVLYGEDRITPAKRVALALAELVQTRYPKDLLEVVLFGDEATQVPLGKLPYIEVGPYHTNTRAGLRMAADLLRRSRRANKQVVMLTDGKPSVITEPDGTIYRNPFGLDERIVRATLDEAARLRRLSIPVTTFMLTDDPVLVDFVDTFTQINKGRAFLSRPDDLGGTVLVDYVRNRRRRVR